MAIRAVRVNHPLLARLRELDKETARRFPRAFDPGLGQLGLLFDKKLDDSRYEWCTPLNCRTFAGTGGEGVHFSFLVRGSVISKASPVVVTVPPNGGQSFVVGASLFDFLCLGFYRGFFALEQLAYDQELTLEVFTNPQWQATEPWHYSVGYELAEQQQSLLQFLREELGLRPWANAARFNELQLRYGRLLDYPGEK